MNALIDRFFSDPNFCGICIIVFVLTGSIVLGLLMGVVVPGTFPDERESTIQK
jgi:hypothetical protein